MTMRQTSFLRKALAHDESVQVEAHLHWVRYAKSYCELAIGCALLLSSIWLLWVGVVGVFPLFFGLMNWLYASCTQMVVTNRRVICKTGILSIQTEELLDTRIESVEIKQTLMGRLLGYATITFSGTGTSGVVFADVADPWEVKKAIDLTLRDSLRA